MLPFNFVSYLFVWSLVGSPFTGCSKSHCAAALCIMTTCPSLSFASTRGFPSCFLPCLSLSFASPRGSSSCFFLVFRGPSLPLVDPIRVSFVVCRGLSLPLVDPLSCFLCCLLLPFASPRGSLGIAVYVWRASVGAPMYWVLGWVGVVRTH